MHKKDIRKQIRPPGQEYLAQFAAKGTVCSSNHIPLSTGVSLLVTTFNPVNPGKFPPVVFIPGLLSGMENFRPVLQELTRDFRVSYIETREKRTSICSRDADFSIPVLASDVTEVIAGLGLIDREYILLGYSMGASVIMEGFRRLGRKPAALVVIVPTTEFRFPGWSLKLAKVAAPFYGLLKPFLKWYIRHFHVNVKEDIEMHRIQVRILDAADPRKLCAIIPAIASYKVWDRVSFIDIPLLVIGASKDSLHNHGDALRLSSVARDSRFVDLETNERNHGGEVVVVIREFVKSLNLFLAEFDNIAEKTSNDESW
jgi:pimeloyl-ACP methyl ester carboxylesterase